MSKSKIDKSPKHGTTNPDDRPESQSQADGTAAEAPRGETQAAQPSGYNSENPATAGKRSSPAQSHTPEGKESSINPSAPTEGTEVGSVKHGQDKGTSLSDSFGEAGDPHGRGNLQVPEQTVGKDPNPEKPGKEGRADVKRKKDVA